MQSPGDLRLRLLSLTVPTAITRPIVRARVVSSHDQSILSVASTAGEERHGAKSSVRFDEILVVKARPYDVIQIDFGEKERSGGFKRLGGDEIGSASSVSPGAEVLRNGGCELQYEAEWRENTRSFRWLAECARQGSQGLRRAVEGIMRDIDGHRGQLGTGHGRLRSFVDSLGATLASDAFRSGAVEQFARLDDAGAGTLGFEKLFVDRLETPHLWWSALMKSAGADFLNDLDAPQGSFGASRALLHRQWQIFDAEGKDRLDADDFVHFLSAIALWQLACGGTAAAICAQCAMESYELAAIWRRFQEYDGDLSQTIAVSAVGKLLEDMGGGYSTNEMQLIHKSMETVDSGVVDILEFSRWWSSAGGL